jgi:hypothetical protein
MLHTRSFPLVEMGPEPVRVQAALEAVVYAAAMTPLHVQSELVAARVRGPARSAALRRCQRRAQHEHLAAALSTRTHRPALLVPLTARPRGARHTGAGESQLDDYYRDLCWALLGGGQRQLALLVARTRFKICPTARAAGACVCRVWCCACSRFMPPSVCGGRVCVCMYVCMGRGAGTSLNCTPETHAHTHHTLPPPCTHS